MSRSTSWKIRSTWRLNDWKWTSRRSFDQPVDVKRSTEWKWRWSWTFRWSFGQLVGMKWSIRWKWRRMEVRRGVRWCGDGDVAHNARRWDNRHHHSGLHGRGERPMLPLVLRLLSISWFDFCTFDSSIFFLFGGFEVYKLFMKMLHRDGVTITLPRGDTTSSCPLKTSGKCL